MIIFYIDESGTGLKDRQSQYFILSCFSIRAEDWQRLDSSITTLKRRLVPWAKTEDWEIKGRDLRRGDNVFRTRKWPERAQAFHDIAQFMQRFPCRLFTVQVDKGLLPRSVETDSDLYRIAFWQLLDVLDTHLAEDKGGEMGLLMLDMRSDMHSSVQDRRVLDAYRDWVGTRSGQTRFFELPWFGFSNFYAGIQLADFCAYLTDFATNERETPKRSTVLYEAFELLKPKQRLIQIP